MYYLDSPFSMISHLGSSRLLTNIDNVIIYLIFGGKDSIFTVVHMGPCNHNSSYFSQGLPVFAFTFLQLQELMPYIIHVINCRAN